MAWQPIRSSAHMYSHNRATKSLRKRKERIPSQEKVKSKGWRGERIAKKVRGHETTAKRLGKEAADDTTLGMTLTAPVSI